METNTPKRRDNKKSLRVKVISLGNAEVGKVSSLYPKYKCININNIALIKINLHFYWCSFKIQLTFSKEFAFHYQID